MEANTQIDSSQNSLILQPGIKPNNIHDSRSIIRLKEKYPDLLALASTTELDKPTYTHM